LLVGAFDPLDEKEARRVGADGVLKKPFVPPDPLIAMVNSLLPKTMPPEPEPVKEEIAAPTIQQPPPPILPAQAPYVASEAEETTPEEFTFGTAPRDFEGADNSAPVFGEPVATPTAKHMEEEDNYEEPASEWKRRRSTMEYGIPAAESANMVEKLASGNVVPDEETLDTSVNAKAHVPFGGANVPEKIGSISTAPSKKWMDLMGAAETETTEPNVEETHEAPAHVEEESTVSEVSSEPSNGSFNKYTLAKKEDAPNYTVPEEPTQHNDPEPEPAPKSMEQTEWPAPPADVIPFRAHRESSAPAYEASNEKSKAETVVQDAPKLTSYSAEATVEATVEPEKPALERVYEAPTEAPVAEAFVHNEVQEESRTEAMETPHAASVESAVSEAVSAAGAKSAGMDAAAIDSVVAKLLEKLEPQIHEALSTGVLRPLVVEILNREREKK
ncbi:MAG: hypothetical protein ACRD4H_05700, partial [Candidatus Acidiferrales bacterium]